MARPVPDEGRGRVTRQAEREAVSLVPPLLPLTGSSLFALPLLLRLVLQDGFLRHAEHLADGVVHAFGITVAGDIRWWRWLHRVFPKSSGVGPSGDFSIPGKVCWADRKYGCSTVI